MINIQLDNKKKQGVLSGEHFDEIREHFSVKNEAAQFARRFAKFIPQRTYAITPTGRFDACLFFEIKKFIVSSQYTQQINVSEDFLNEVLPGTLFKKQPHYNSDIIPLALPLREYQAEIVKKAFTSGRGTIVLATAGGKTLTAASLLTKLFLLYGNKFKALYIVPDLGLVEQTANDFYSYRVPFTCSKWTGSNPLDRTTHIVIANLGILQSKNTDLSWIEDIDCLIIDEVHKIRKGNEINKIIKKIKTSVRFGFTGTLPEGLVDQWNIIGKIGPIIYEKNSYELKVENFVAPAIIYTFLIRYKTRPAYPQHNYDATDKYRVELDFLIKNNFRNNLILKISNKTKNNALILVDFIEHGLTLENLLKNNLTNKQVFFIRGEVDIQEREEIKKIIENSQNVVVIAISKIFSTGINIKNLHYIIFAGGGKSKIKILQSIGRGLRLHKDKDKLIIIDIADNLLYGEQHFNKRKQLYEKENIPHQIKEIKEI